MPLPILADQTPLQLVVKGSAGDTTDMENVIYGIYAKGATPFPGGLNLADVADNFTSTWQTLWTPFMSDISTFTGTTIRVLDSITAVPPRRFKFTVTEQWSVFHSYVGAVGGGMLPSFNAFPITKRMFVAGKGKQGHVRPWGVPVNLTAGNELTSINQANIQAALNSQGTVFAVVPGPNTDAVQMVIVNGPRVNANPGHPVTFYMDAVEELQCDSVLASQITRKLGRRRT